jgi:hypothetical protein
MCMLQIAFKASTARHTMPPFAAAVHHRHAIVVTAIEASQVPNNMTLGHDLVLSTYLADHPSRERGRQDAGRGRQGV